MFDVWAGFLSSEESRYVLHHGKSGWFSDEALKALDHYFDEGFEHVFKCTPGIPYLGYTSWDDFFARALKPGVRVVEFPDNPNIINAPCESKLYKIAHGVREFDTFWLKGEPYSLNHMLNQDPDYAKEFEGGTVFQGYLDVTSYHRWHSPVTGVIKKIVRVEGTYFAQSPALLGELPLDPDDPKFDHYLPPFLRSLAFLTSVATRALVFIESSNPLIGLMCSIAIGMTEISTCEVTVGEGQEITKGDQLGLFHFGGSLDTLVFRAGTNITFFEGYNMPGDHIKVRAAIAGVA